MFSALTDKRLKLFDSNLMEISDSGADIEESASEGYAKVSLKSDHKLVVFKKMERNKLQNLKCKNCADYIVFEEQDQNMKVHIFEMKRTVKSKEWKHIKKQFLGAIINAYALAGVLGEALDKHNIRLYTCYRRDLLQTPAALRYALAAGDTSLELSDWNGKEILLKDLEQSKFQHEKIQLDEESGCAVYQL